jgi:hypothetical protein
MAWPHFFVAGAVLETHGQQNHNTNWQEAVSSANSPFLKEASQNCFVFDVANSVFFVFWWCEFPFFEKALTELLRFGPFNLHF